MNQAEAIAAIRDSHPARWQNGYAPATANRGMQVQILSGPPANLERSTDHDFCQRYLPYTRATSNSICSTVHSSSRSAIRSRYISRLPIIPTTTTAIMSMVS